MFIEAIEKRALPDLMPDKILITGHGGGIAEFTKALSDPIFSRYKYHSGPFLAENISLSIRARFKNADYFLNKPHLNLMNFYLIYAAE